jgi:hypothetical protein
MIGMQAVLVQADNFTQQAPSSAPTVTPLPIFAILAANSGWAPLTQRPLRLP